MPLGTRADWPQEAQEAQAGALRGAALCGVRNFEFRFGQPKAPGRASGLRGLRMESGVSAGPSAPTFPARRGVVAPLGKRSICRSPSLCRRRRDTVANRVHRASRVAYPESLPPSRPSTGLAQGFSGGDCLLTLPPPLSKIIGSEAGFGVACSGPNL